MLTNPVSNLNLAQTLEESECASEKEPTIALLHCYDLIDDFLDSIDISFETFCQEFVGSWIFSYIHALNTAGVRTVLICISARVTEIEHYQHRPSGALLCVVPASNVYKAYRLVRNCLLRAYGGEPGQSFSKIQDFNAVRRSLLTGIKDILKSVGSYLSTPLNPLETVLRQEGCQAILCQEYEFARFDACVWLGKRLKVPVFATFQGGDVTQSPLEFLPRRFAFHACSGVVIATKTEIKRVQQTYSVPEIKIARVFNPINIAEWKRQSRQQARDALGIPDTARMAVWHGRIEIERKGLDLLLDAWKQICDDCPQQDFRLWLIGMGSDATKLRDRLSKQPLPGVTWIDEFINDRDRIRQYLSAADLYVMPSRQEGFPVAPLEAMACGLPVVATDAPGIPDILEKGKASGGLVVPRDDINSLVDAIQYIFSHPSEAQELSRQARLRVEQQFTYEVVGKQLRSFLLPNMSPDKGSI